MKTLSHLSCSIGGLGASLGGQCYQCNLFVLIFPSFPPLRYLPSPVPSPLLLLPYLIFHLLLSPLLFLHLWTSQSP